MIISLNLQVDSDIDFKSVKIDDLTDENCIYLDEQNDDTLTDQVEAIKAKTEEVINEHLIEQGLKPAENETPEDNQTAMNMEALKEEAKNKLVNSISEAMATAQNEGRQYTLNDLITLDIPGSAFTVSIEGDEATLSIDGFEFKLNSEFQLYE